MSIEIVCAADIIPKQRKSCVTWDKIAITIDVEHEYHIELHRINTHEKILAWILHLNEKTWVTKEIIDDLIKAAMEANKISINRSL